MTIAQGQKGEKMDDLISRQAAIDAVNEWLKLYAINRTMSNVTSMQDILRQLPSVQPEQQWIPCSERLPDEDLLTGTGKQYSADVLMTVFNTIDDETIIDYGHTIDGEWYSDTTDCYIPHWWKVIAWCEQPEPYKGEQE